jgi:Tfp pilus assembly protein PilO
MSLFTKDFLKKYYTETRYLKYLEKLPSFKQEKTQVFTTLTLTLITLSIFGVFAISPTLSTIAQLQRRLEDSKFVHEKLNEKINNLSSLQRQYTQIEGDLPILLAGVPQAPEVPLFTGQIQALASLYNITLLRLQVFQVELAKETEGQNKFSSFAFSLDVRGSTPNFLSFVSALSNFERIVTIDTISITKGSDTTGPQLNIRGKVYFKK